MEKASQRNLHVCLSLAELVGFFIFDAILITAKRLKKFDLRSLRCTSSRIHNEECKKHVTNETREDLELRREDIEMVMEKIGMSFSQEGNREKKFITSDEFSAMFEENEPSLEEVKEAFCVFDENSDGFIDAKELQRVLCKLGFREGVDLDACHMMIVAHDQDQDGRINFHDFVKFMESSFC